MRFFKNVPFLWFVELLEYFFFFLLPNLVKLWPLCFQITFSTLLPYLFLFFLWTPVTHVRPSDFFSQVFEAFKSFFPILFSLFYRLENFTDFFLLLLPTIKSSNTFFITYIEGFRICIRFSLVF